MDDEDEEFEEIDSIDFTRAVPARGIDWVIVGVDFARKLVDATSSAIWNVEQLLIGQANHEVQQAEFQDEARRQIEMMTEGE